MYIFKQMDYIKNHCCPVINLKRKISKLRKSKVRWPAKMAASLQALWVKAGMICAYAEASAQAFCLILRHR